MRRIELIIGAVVIALILVSFYIQYFHRKDRERRLEGPQSTSTISEGAKEEDIRQPAVAGQFYPADKQELSAAIDDYLKEAKLSKFQGTPQILISPHAGYIYSGKVAAYAFKQLEGSNFKRAILIGRSHQELFSEIVADSHKFWSTPLGNVAVDQEFINLLSNQTPVVKINSSPHDQEHSLEVLVPFLIKVLGQDVKIVPLLFGDEKEEAISALAEALEKTIDRSTVIVISSDLSHYPTYSDALTFDQKTIATILNTAGGVQFQQKVMELEQLNAAKVSTLACARPAIATSIALARKLDLEPHLLKYANSGDYFPETKNRVVGYAAIIFNNLRFNELPEAVESLASLAESRRASRELNIQEQKVALQIARQTLTAAFEKKDYQLQVSAYPIFQTKRGAFVTLRKHGQLRGCIGSFEPDQSLAEVIKSMALAAAFHDSRFLPLQKDELKEVEIEISVLSPRQKIASPDIIEAGKHGVYLQRGTKSGVYLPQVASEQGWDKETFLNSLCEEKTGLEKDCWRNGSADLYIFTAQIFEEE